MKVDLSKEEASIIQFAIVSTDELWRKEGSHYVPKDEVIQRILDKMHTILEEDEKQDEAVQP